jgi:GTP-binding protein
MLIDSARIYVKAGSGGRGCNSFYRDKYTRKGIPDGGDGGKGASIIIRADRNLHTLLDFQYNRHFIGRHGAHGSGKQKKGKDAPDIIIRVPCGTTVKDINTDCILRDLDKDQEEFVVARGGMGGKGNRHAGQATDGRPGQERELLLDLKLIADAGVVGFPNAGKSTLISNVSNAHPEIAAYPFTTKFPVLGVVKARNKIFVIADVPGLIEGSSSGRGLGHKFLRHLERTRIIVHLVDMSGWEGRNPVEDYNIINQELKNYSGQLYKKPQIIAANKMDLENAAVNLAKFKKSVKKKVYPISALRKQGLEELIEAIAERL